MKFFCQGSFSHLLAELCDLYLNYFFIQIMDSSRARHVINIISIFFVGWKIGSNLIRDDAQYSQGNF